MEAMSSQDVVHQDERRAQQDTFYGFLLPATAVHEFLPHALVPRWRGLVQSEVNLEHCLQNFPPHFIAEFCLHSSAGRSAQERGDLESATASFLHCKTQLEAANETVEKQMYKWLLARVDLPLAQLYQMRSSAEIPDSDRRAELLEKALEIREEILDCVMPLQNSHSLVVGVCLSYCLTAQYEWGSLTADFEAKNDAIYKYAELFRCEIPEAEPQLCHFLYLDHYLTGNFETSLRWIQEAHRLWKELSDPDGSYYASYCFECEAKLFMQLDKCPEAANSLENLLNAKDYAHQKHPQFAATVHEWLQECYTQLSRKADDPQLAKSYEESAELQHALKCSLSSDDHQESTFAGIPKSHPIMMPTPFPIGSSLGLVQELTDFEKHLTKLPAVIGDLFNGHCKRAQAAQKCSDWEAAISAFQTGREILKLSKKMTDQETHDWLLTWVDLPLANLYHFHAMKFEKAVEIWKEMQDCMKHRMPRNDFLYQGYAYFTFLSAVEYEWACSHTSDGKYKIVQEHATRYHAITLHAKDDKRAERDLCFWLYFGHFCQTCSSLEQSLRWLREAERLDKLHSPDRMCSSDEYFCCDYDYLRCEAEVLMALHNYEEAICKLESLLKTRHVRQGSPSLARETRRWLQDCYVKIYGADAESIQQALECSLTIDNHQHEGIGDEVPSPTGCMMLVQTNHTCEPTCGHTHQLTQSKSGLEQHLRQLPGPVRLAFRKHSNLGLLGQDHADWEGAIFNFEWCRELLRFSRAVTDKKSYAWLLVWADLPLAQLYEFRKMHFKKALNIWKEMFCSLPQDVDEVIYMAIALNFYVQAGMYQCADKDYPDLKDTVVKNFGTWGMLSMQDYVGRLDDWNSEVTLLAFLKKQHFDFGNLEKCLHFAQEARRVVFEQRLSEDEHDKKTNDNEKLKYVVEEAVCYINLNRFEDAKQVMDKYGEGIDGEGILEILKKECDQERVSYEALLELPSSSPLQELRLESCVLEENGRYEEAVKRHEQCLEVIGKLRNDSRGLDTTIDKGFELGLYGRCGDEFYDYLRIGELHKKMYCQTFVTTYLERLSSLSAAELEAPDAQDAKLLRAVECFEKCIELSVPLGNSGQASHIDHHLVELYALFDTMYYVYIIHIYNEIGTKMSLPASSNSVPLVEQLHIKLCKEIVAYLYLPDTLEKFVQRASVQHANMLYTRERYIESFIITPMDNIPYKLPYIHIQEHYCRKARLLHIMGSYGQMEEKEKFEKGAEALRWKAFIYAEMERARATLYQLGPSKIRDVASHELRKFENDDLFALKAIREDYTALFKNDAVFVMFSHTNDEEIFLIYVIDQDGKLSVTQTELKGRPNRSLQKRLNHLHLYFERPRSLKGYTDELMNEDLEFLYDMLLRPVADQLDKMEEEHKLIIVPSEILAQVPFSALRDRNRPSGLRYLIERHTIALTSSLRVQAKLSERLRELQNSSPVGLGSIVALGDPAYGKNHVPLRASGDEVRHIASLFPSESVITLLAEDASAKNLLDWIEKPSHEPTFRQAIVHIGAHGVVYGQRKHEDHTMSVLHLACHGRLAGDDSNVVSRGKEPQVDDEQEEDVYNIVENYETDSTSRSQPECQGAIASCSNATLEGSRSEAWMPSSCDAYDLKAGDIIDSKIKWRAELVVLSACRTSQGKMTGEGVLSLARAFMIAGVPCVVASQWEVGDRATSDQMRLFYNSLRTGELDVASALRSSMLQMLKPNKDGKAPFHVRNWAPFVVWGVPTLRIPDSLQQQELGHGKEIMVDQRSVPTLHPDTMREVQDATSSLFQVGLWTGRKVGYYW